MWLKLWLILFATYKNVDHDWLNQEPFHLAHSRPRSRYWYSNMAPTLSGHNCKFVKFLFCPSIALMHDEIRPANFTTFKMQITNFIVDKFPKQQIWKEYPRGNNTKVPEVWGNFSLMGLGGKFWVCDVIMHKETWIQRLKHHQIEKFVLKASESC